MSLLRWAGWAGIQRVCVFVVEELEEQTREAELHGLFILVFVLCLHGCLHEAGEDKSEEAVC